MACTGHSHDYEDEDQLGLSLQRYIDMPRVYCLNEHTTNAGQSILKPFEDRLTVHPSLQSPRDDDDIELLFHIPFSEAVTIRNICVHSRASIYAPQSSDGTIDRDRATSAPFSVKVFANRSDLDFDTARDLEGDVRIDLAPPEHLAEIQVNQSQPLDAGMGSSGGDGDGGVGGATLDYPLRPGSKFKYCNSITLFFGDNFASKLAEVEGGDADEVIPTEITYVGFKGEGTSVKRVAVKAVYETRGMKKDHTVPGGEFGAESKPGV
mmetsp:Transcript_22428/g.33564  ORF Transcript_22428/g.33564 Transcript_22428/m.33564 type:complete len:265 (+) Transcript_22428:50-844(+)